MNGLDYKIEDAGGGQYRFIFGDDVETLTLDGKGHVTKYGDTWSIKTTGPSSWESTNERDGKVTNKSKWTVSADGQTFTSTDENMRPDGSTGKSEAVFKRTGGTSGLAATGNPSVKSSSVPPALLSECGRLLRRTTFFKELCIQPRTIIRPRGRASPRA